MKQGTPEESFWACSEETCAKQDRQNTGVEAASGQPWGGSGSLLSLPTEELSHVNQLVYTLSFIISSPLSDVCMVVLQQPAAG